MSAWLPFWTAVLAVACVLFAGLAVVVGIGGFQDVRDLFRKIEAQHAEREESEP